MEQMHSYNEFPNDVKKAFANLTSKYGLTYHPNGICSVDIKNKFCRLNFNMDRYDLQGLLFKTGDSTSFGLIRLANDLDSKDFSTKEIPITEYNNQQSIRELLNFYSKMIDSNLSHVLQGDFSWYNRIKSEDNYEKKLVGVIIGSKIEYEHPISKKFWSGDSSWKPDLEEYIKKNGIKI